MVYVIVHDEDVQETQDEGQESDNNPRSKVDFQSTVEVQEYDPSSGQIQGESEVVHTEEGTEQAKSKPPPDTSGDTSDSNAESTEDEESSEESSESNSSSNSSSQSPGETHVSETTKKNKKSSKTFDVSKMKESTPIKRVKNLTRDVVAATAKMKQNQVKKKAAPRGKQKPASGRGSGRAD